MAGARTSEHPVEAEVSGRAPPATAGSGGPERSDTDRARDLATTLDRTPTEREPPVVDPY
jgi:hypothetical protein